MSDRNLEYGPSSGQSGFGAVFMVVLAVVLGIVHRDHAASLDAGWGFGMQVGAIVVLLSFVGAVTLVLQARDPERHRSEGLVPTDTGLDCRPKLLFMRDVIASYDTVRKLQIVNEEGIVDPKIKHAGGTITLHRMWFEDRVEFDACAGMVAARSGRNVKRGWLN